jgi:hypothetical protein
MIGLYQAVPDADVLLEFSSSEGESAHFAYGFEHLTEARPEPAPAKFGSRVIANDY